MKLKKLHLNSIKQFALLLLLLIFFSNCKKDTEVSGVVLDSITKKPLEGIEVRLYHFHEASFASIFLHDKFLGKTITNADGTFYIKDYNGKANHVHAKWDWTSSSEYTNITTGESQRIDNAKGNNVELYVTQESKVLFKNRNVNPYDNNDLFKMNEDVFAGSNVNTSFFSEPRSANTDAYFLYYVTRNGVETGYWTPLIYVSSDTTTIYELDY